MLQMRPHVMAYFWAISFAYVGMGVVEIVFEVGQIRFVAIQTPKNWVPCNNTSKGSTSEKGS